MIVTSKRALQNHQDRHPYLRWMDWIANRLSHVITANSEAVAKDVARRDGVPVSQIVVIPNGLDLSRFDDALPRRDAVRRDLKLMDGQIGIVKVANLIPYKGHVDLIRAFDLIARDNPDLRLFIVGQDRGIQADLERQASEAGLADRVIFLGRRQDVADILCAMDIAVMASHEEGFSNALLEKLGAGLPVVATDVGGNAEALAGMPNCHLVRARDPDDLARGLRETIDFFRHGLDDKEFRRRRVGETYSVEAMTDAYERIYLSHLNARR